MNEWIINEWMCAWMNGWISAWMNEWKNEWVNEWINELMNECMKEGMTEWVSEWWMSDAESIKWSWTAYSDMSTGVLRHYVKEKFYKWLNHYRHIACSQDFLEVVSFLVMMKVPALGTRKSYTGIFEGSFFRNNWKIAGYVPWLKSI